MATIPVTPTVVKDIVDNAEERELWIVGREFERPPYFIAGKGGDTRLTRALRLCADEKITPNSDGSYQVEGSHGRSYRVADSCSCPNSQKASTKWCYHAVAVALYVEWQQRIRPAQPVALGTLRAGTLPLGPATIDERLAQAVPNFQAISDRLEQERLAMGTMRDSSSLSTHHTPQEDRMDDNEYIPEPDELNTPVAVLESPVATPVTRQLPGPVLLPSLDARTLEQSMQAYAAQRQVVTRYIKEQMTEGVDYYTLTIKGRVSKATLSKAGSEKFLSLFQLHAAFQQDEATWRMLGSKDGLLCYTCTLLTRQGEVIGEGRGARSVSQDGGDINKAIKMATKCLGGTTPVVIKNAQGINTTLLNQLVDRPIEHVFIAGPEGTWRKIIRLEKQPSGPVKRLTFRDGFTVTASLDHRWPLHNGTLRSTEDLRLGDVLSRSTLPTGDGNADPDFAWMAGLYVAEGSMDTAERNVRFSLHADEEGLAMHLLSIAERLGSHAYAAIKGNAQTVYMFGPAPIGLLQHFVQGRLSYGKHFTHYLWRQQPKVLKAALMGYLVGDGSLVEREGRQAFWGLGFTRQNRSLANDLRTLCAMLGYRCRLGHGMSTETRTHKRFGTYTGWIKMVESRWNEQPLEEIVAIEDGEEMTYEIEVDGDHLFCLANGLVTHNSAQVDAVLRTGALSDVFTQDLDDAQPEPVKPNPLHPAAELRQRIWAKCQELAPDARTREAVEAFVQERTGMALHPDLFQAILARLET